MKSVFVLLFGAALLTACPPSSSSGSSGTPSNPVATCTKGGVACTFKEGKLGLCVEATEPCDGQVCYVCQSQH